MYPRIPVYVYAKDAITKSGLSSQLRPEQRLELIDKNSIGPGTAVIAAVDSLEDETLQQLRVMSRLSGGCLVLVVGTLNDAGLLAAIEIGVRAVVHRNEATPAKLVSVVARTMRDEAALPADVLARLLKQVSRLQHSVLQPRGLTVSGLSTRESEVLRLVADGMDTNEIAVELNFSARTVKNILSSITTRYCLRNRAHAVAFALREGLI